MPTYVAFLRAINLGPSRKFPKDAIRACAEAVGGRDVETYINTGNLRLTTGHRSSARVEAVLERAFLEDRGFEVPTIAYTPRELSEIAAEADRLGEGLDDDGRQYVSLLKEPAPAAVAAELEGRDVPGERAWVRGRAVHIRLERQGLYHEATITNALVEKTVGVATNRNVTVIRELARRWGDAGGS
jgi:uncharacterized protein (DUF1697 family)